MPTIHSMGIAPPNLAGNILRCLSAGDAGALETALDRAERCGADAMGGVIPADVAERLELIGAIAAELRACRRIRPGAEREAVEPLMPLLRNLARGRLS